MCAALLLAAVGSLLTTPVLAAQPMLARSLCLFDPVGKNGPVYAQLQNYTVAALQWGVRFNVRSYTDEGVAASDFATKKCDAVAFTGIRNMQFIKFAGSLDMLGGLQTYRQEKMAMEIMLTPKAAPLLVQNGVELAGILPGGKVFLFARDRDNLASLEKAAGKKVAILNNDKQATTFANIAGASAVSATIATFGPMFNNGNVDYAYAPSFAFEALEMYKGLGNKGGIADFPLGMLSLQMDVYQDRFPAGFAKQSRDWVSQNLMPTALKLERGYDAKIPKKFWVHITQDRVLKYAAMLVQIRQHLWDANHYDHRMQHLLKKIRCQDFGSQLAECSGNTEGGPV
ncbi:MAG: RND transporter [Nevskiaceae bacterium]|nr:MAG: RND transporter [Nevskiaceae bacterium]TBR74167.1 MAG: RND transporter [Nevskiaceae bacterium]